MNKEVTKRILFLLCEDNETEIFSFHERYNISPGVLSEVLTELNNKGYIRMHRRDVIITPSGRAYIFMNRKNLDSDNNYWNQIPSKMVLNKM